MSIPEIKVSAVSIISPVKCEVEVVNPAFPTYPTIANTLSL
jgi:hypothetical protein